MVFSSFYGLFAQETDFITGNITILINPKNKSVEGEVTYTFTCTKTDSIFINAKNIKILSLLVNDMSLEYKYDFQRIGIRNAFGDGEHTISITYKTHPKKAMYFIDSGFVWTQGQGKDNSNWVPTIDDYNDKIQFKIQVTSNKNYRVISNGILKTTTTKDTLKTWEYQMNEPMSSYLLAIVVGKYDYKSLESKSGIPLQFYTYPQDSLKIEPTYRYSEKMFNYLEKEIGVAFPWQIYRQVPVKDFLHGGMENTTLTIFPDELVVDSIAFYDQNYISTNAHELAHQWFGNFVTQKRPQDHWLQEGFATYYSLLAEKNIYGKGYFYASLYDIFIKLKDKKGQAIISDNASSFTYYQKAAFALHVLRQKMGYKKFRHAVKTYLNTYRFNNASSEDFLSVAQRFSGTDLNIFKKQWLLTDTLDYQTILETQKLTFFRKTRHRAQKLYKTNFAFKKHQNNITNNLFLEITDTLSTKKKHQVNIAALETDDINLHHIVLRNLESINTTIKPYIEKQLYVNSYLSKELALEKLCKSFPQEAKRYLQVNETLSFADAPTHRIIWIYFAIVYDFNSKRTNRYIEELIGYTAPKFSIETRHLVFSVLFSLNIISEEVLINILEACVHHKYQFKTFARTLLKKMIPYAKNDIDMIKAQLSDEAIIFLTSKYPDL